MHPTAPPPPAGQGLLCDVIDLEQGPSAAADETGGLVHRGVCAQLDALRDQYDSLPELLTEARGGPRGRVVAWAPAGSLGSARERGQAAALPAAPAECRLTLIALAVAAPPPQVVEGELARIPPAVARRHTQQLWSITYLPQARAHAGLRAAVCKPRVCRAAQLAAQAVCHPQCACLLRVAQPLPRTVSLDPDCTPTARHPYGPRAHTPTRPPPHPARWVT